jgi:hypothetical protein
MPSAFAGDREKITEQEISAMQDCRNIPINLLLLFSAVYRIATPPSKVKPFVANGLVRNHGKSVILAGV